jgi:hypothetical protein
MDKNSLFRKCLVVGIIFLFVGVSIVPIVNFHIVKASDDNDLVEVTTQPCGIEGFGNTTVKLTREQYQNLEQYMVKFRERLNQTSTMEEAGTIFKDAVVELYTYGLLPKGMSVGQAQRLVTERYQNVLAISRYTTRLSDYQILNNSNFFCLIAGGTKETSLHSHFEIGCSILTYMLFGLYILAHLVSDDPVVFMNIIYFIQGIRDLYHTIHLLSIIGSGMISFGTCIGTEGSIPPFYHLEPATGWITTLGFFGKKSWDGSFYGHIQPLLSFDASETIYYIGAMGFQGIKLKQGDEGLFFLGSAVLVKID